MVCYITHLKPCFLAHLLLCFSHTLIVLVSGQKGVLHNTSYFLEYNNLPQCAQTFDFDLKSCISCIAQHFLSLGSLLTSLRLTLVDLVCLGPRVALIVVHLSPSQFSNLCFAQHLKLQCTLLILNLSPSQSFFLCFSQHLQSF